MSYWESVTWYNCLYVLLGKVYVREVEDYIFLVHVKYHMVQLPFKSVREVEDFIFLVLEKCYMVQLPSQFR